jgi:DNA-binding NarL/FixJ family response regulator
MRIFLVEDSLVVRGQLAAMLATIPGAEIVGEAQSALPAIRDILALRPQLVLLDVHLADGSGFDVLNAVHVAAPEIDFCMLTSFAPHSYRQLAGRLGARAVFDKRMEFGRVRDLVVRRIAAGHVPRPSVNP